MWLYCQIQNQIFLRWFSLFKKSSHIWLVTFFFAWSFNIMQYAWDVAQKWKTTKTAKICDNTKLKLPGCASNRRHERIFFLNIICMVSTWSHHPCIVQNSTGQHQQNRHFLTAVYRCKMRQWCKNTHCFCLIIFDTFFIELLAANGACKNQIICKVDSNINNSLTPNTILCQCRRNYSPAHKTALNNVFLVTLPP